MKKVITTSLAPAPVGPYNQAILAGNTLYISGQISINPETNEFLDLEVEEQTILVLNNLKAILEAAEMQLTDVVKCSIFVTNMADFKIVNDVYASFFETMEPARETVEVSALPKGAKVEISCIAIK